MGSSILSRTRRWLGASALALIVAAGGASTALVVTSQGVTAQVREIAQITVPQTVAVGSFADLVEAVKPAVVSIRVQGENQRSVDRGFEFNFSFPDLPEDHPFRDFFDNFSDNFAPGQRQQQPRRFVAAGSGFVISEDGYVVTNNHVVENASTITVVFEDGTEQVAELVGVDERTDLAVLKVDGDDLAYVTFEDQRSRVGDWVVAVGNPFGLGGTVTVGIISASGRDISGSSYGDFLQIDAAVNTGNSGGPAFNLQGQVAGVNTAIYSPNGGNVGIAFAIPASTVKQIVTQLISDGSVTRGYLGVTIQDVTRDIADGVGLSAARGAIVREPVPGGPADAAGIRSGDVVLSIDGRPISDALDLSRTIGSLAPGSSVAVVLWRDGGEVTLAIPLGTLDEAAPETPQPRPTPPVEIPTTESSVGIDLVPNSGTGGGLLIRSIAPDSPAADRGLAVGDLILEVDNKTVASLAQFEAALDAVRARGLGTALVKTSRGGEARFIGMPLGN